MQAQPLAAEDRKALEEHIEEIQNQQELTLKTAGFYESAAVTLSCSTGPKGAKMSGWLTFKAKKIHFKSTSVRKHRGLFAGGAALPTVPVLNELKGKTGTYKWSGPGALTMVVDGTPVFYLPVPIAGTPIHGSAEGTVEFT